MKRQKKEAVEKTEAVEKQTWRKITPGTLYPLRDRGVFVRQGETIQATAEELGSKIDQFELVDSSAIIASVPETESGNEVPKFTIQHLGDDWYNVTSSTGEVMNQENLTLADAEALKQALETE